MHAKHNPSLYLMKKNNYMKELCIDNMHVMSMFFGIYSINDGIGGCEMTTYEYMGVFFNLLYPQYSIVSL